MKRLGKLKLNQISKADLEKREMNFLIGGGTPGTCTCGCSNGNTNTNCRANDYRGYTKSKGMNDEYANCCTCGSGNTLGTFSTGGDMKNLLIFIVLIITGGCTNPPGNLSNPSSPVIDLTNCEFSDPIKLSSIAENIDYIPLETISESLLYEGVLAYMSDSIIFIDQRGGILLFNKQGKFLRSLFNIGQGPDEGFARCCALDYENQRFFMYNNFRNSIECYDFQGKHINSFKDPIHYSHHTRNISIFKNHIILNDDYLQDSFFSVFNIDSPDSAVYAYKNTYSTVLTKPVVMYDAYCAEFQHKDSVFYFKEQFCDTLFYTPDFIHLYPKYIFQWDKRKSGYDKYAKVHSLELWEPDFEQGLYRIVNWMEGGRYFFFMLQTPLDRYLVNRYLGMYNNEDGTLQITEDVRIINDIDGGVDFTPFSSFFLSNQNVYKDQIFLLAYPHELKEAYIQNKTCLFSQQRKKLKELADSLLEDDNPVLMIVTLKNDDNKTN